jgi:hypothetical protein
MFLPRKYNELLAWIQWQHPELKNEILTKIASQELEKATARI